MSLTGLKSKNLKVYVGKIEKEVIAYLNEKWGKSGTVNLLDALSELTILTASRCLHGDDVRDHLFADVANLYHDLDKGVILMLQCLQLACQSWLVASLLDVYLIISLITIGDTTIFLFPKCPDSCSCET